MVPNSMLKTLDNKIPDTGYTEDPLVDRMRKLEQAMYKKNKLPADLAYPDYLRKQRNFLKMKKTLLKPKTAYYGDGSNNQVKGLTMEDLYKQVNKINNNLTHMKQNDSNIRKIKARRYRIGQNHRAAGTYIGSPGGQYDAQQEYDLANEVDDNEDDDDDRYFQQSISDKISFEPRKSVRIQDRKDKGLYDTSVFNPSSRASASRGSTTTPRTSRASTTTPRASRGSTQQQRRDMNNSAKHFITAAQMQPRSGSDNEKQAPKNLFKSNNTKHKNPNHKTPSQNGSGSVSIKKWSGWK